MAAFDYYKPANEGPTYISGNFYSLVNSAIVSIFAVLGNISTQERCFTEYPAFKKAGMSRARD